MPPANPEMILASKSHARKTMLERAGLRFSAVAADLDEEEIIAGLVAKRARPAEIAQELAERKALAVAADHPDTLVIGCDQILVLEGKIFTKARDESEAREKLHQLRGKTHTLISAVAIAQNRLTLWQHSEEARLSMFSFDDAFIEAYAKRAGPALTRAVGGYEIEGAGAWLFSEIEGDFFTILGLPLLPLLSYLHDYHGLRP